jgi:hypothetical protein
MNTIFQKAIDCHAKGMSLQKIDIMPITMIEDYDTDTKEEIPHQEKCPGCMDCLGLSWTDFV